MVERKEYLEQLKAWKDEQVIKVVTGILRCGKSTLLSQYQQQLKTTGITDEQIVSVNFEELEYEELLDYRKLYSYIHWPLDEDITNAELERILFPDKYQKISTYVEPDYPYIHRELARPGVIAARREDDIVAAGIDMIHRLPEQLVDMIRMFDQFMHKIPPPNKKHKRRFAKLQNAFVSGFSIACILSCEIAAVKVMLGRGVCACAEKFYRPCGR